MNVNLFKQFNSDCFTVILSKMPLSGLYRMGLTCSSFQRIFLEIFKENRQECRLLLESGKKYVAIVEPCILELKTGLVGSLLLNKESFNFYAGALSRCIAEYYSDPTLTADPDSVFLYVESMTLMNDKPLLTLLTQHGFGTHLAEAFLEKYKAHKNNHLFYLFCTEIVTNLGPQAGETMEIVFEELYAGWKQALYENLMAECKKSTELADALVQDLKNFNPDYLFEQEDVKGLAAIDKTLHLFNPERRTFKERLAEDIPALFEKMTADLQ